MMHTADPTVFSLILVGILYLVIVGVILKRRGFREWAGGLLLLYVVISSLWTLCQAFSRLGWPTYLADEVPTRALLYGLPLLSLLFLHLNRSFLRIEGRGWYWWGLGGAWVAAVVVLHENPLALPETMWIGPGWTFGRQALAFGVLIVGWGVFMGGATLLTARAYRRTQQPLHRNRIKYWSLALALTAASAALLFARREPLAGGLHLLGTFSAAYAVLTYRLPDVRQMARQTVSYLIAALLTVVIYNAGFVATHAAFQSVPGYSPLLAGATLALAIAMLFDPLLGLVQRLVNRLTSRTRYDPSRTLREYSMQISNILDLERLATTVVGLISEAMEIRRGALFVVHHENEKAGGAQEGGYYRLRGVAGEGEGPPPGTLSAASPVVDYLRREHRPLAQYDVDLLPRFRENSAAERAWLASLDMDVYVPICAKGAWIGLLALGPKASGDRYFDDDLTLLSTVADQTAVALENARLFDDLKNRNAENERLNEELTAANRELARLDQAKSDFIDIASHELRTPLTQVYGYNEILGEIIAEGSLATDVGLQMTAATAKAIRRLEDIVDIMCDVSQLDTEMLVLHSTEVSVDAIVRRAADGWATALEERQQTLRVEGLEALPPITADGERLLQVFSHLIQNAIKYTPDGGHIRITGRLLYERMPPQDQRIEVVVADTGIGIAPDDLERIFNKFYRAGDIMSHSTSKTKFKGAGPGLGLTIARGIVQAHGGCIWAESTGHDEEMRPGSQFHVVLSVQPSDLEPASLEALIAAARAPTVRLAMTV
jgi:signal transduction histidine kinase